MSWKREETKQALLARLAAEEKGYFPDDPDQFTVGAIGAVLNYLGDEEIAYAVGRVLRWSAGLSTYVDAKWGKPDVDEGPALTGFQRAVEEQADTPHPWYG